MRRRGIMNLRHACFVFFGARKILRKEMSWVSTLQTGWIGSSMTFMNQHGDDRAQIDFQISRIELFSAPQIDETAFIQKAVCQEREPNLEQTD